MLMNKLSAFEREDSAALHNMIVRDEKPNLSCGQAIITTSPGLSRASIGKKTAYLAAGPTPQNASH
jgi:hypothetical protein